jgi:hypothetical protein
MISFACLITEMVILKEYTLRYFQTEPDNPLSRMVGGYNQ